MLSAASRLTHAGAGTFDIPMTLTVVSGVYYRSSSFYNVVFFFQAEDGIRDGRVTGVQTCALPILPPNRRISYLALLDRVLAPGGHFGLACFAAGAEGSEERRVGKEWRSRWSP